MFLKNRNILIRNVKQFIKRYFHVIAELYLE